MNGIEPSAKSWTVCSASWNLRADAQRPDPVADHVRQIAEQVVNPRRLSLDPVQREERSAVASVQHQSVLELDATERTAVFLQVEVTCREAARGERDSPLKYDLTCA